MDDLSTKTCCVVDQGLFVELAVRLARDFGRVLYWCPYKSAFPKLKDVAVGEGLEDRGVERVYDLFDVLGEVDLWVFPDVYDADMQAFLREQGKRVWGSGDAQWLELDRERTREAQRQLGVAAPNTKVVKGLTELREELSVRGNRWIKVSYFRGDGETWNHTDPFVSAVYLDELQKRYGPLSEQVEFVVEENVEGVEIAYDCFSVNGNFLDWGLYGVEVKDQAFVARVSRYEDLPGQLRSVYAPFGPILASGNCRSFVSFETRVTSDGVPVVVDPCMRCGSPTTEVWMEMYSNFSEVIWEGAAGRIVTPIPVARWVCLPMIHSQWANKNWTPIAIDPSIRQFVKLRNLACIDGKDYYVPRETELPEIGCVVGFGDTLEEATEMATKVTEGVRGYQLEVHNDSLTKAKEAMLEAQRYGINFGLDDATGDEVTKATLVLGVDDDGNYED